MSARSDKWADEAARVLDRAEATRFVDPELSDALVLLAEAAGKLSQGIAAEEQASHA